ncbi:MAG: hypothetical protein WCQ47_07795 [bacterium]
MKTKVTIVAVVIGIIVSVWYTNTVNTQKSILKQSLERLQVAQQHVDSGNLKAANSLLIQLKIDLAGLDNFYNLPSISTQRENLLRDLAGVEEHFRMRMAFVKKVLNYLDGTGNSNRIQLAQDTIREALLKSENDVTLLGLATYLERLKVQDFKKADESIVPLIASLPEEMNVTEISKNLEAFVQSERIANKESQFRIASEVKSQIFMSSVKTSSKWRPALKGRAMIWDFTKNSIDQAYELLPDDLRASSMDGIVTMFCIVRRENIERGRYSVSNQPAYQERMTISMVYWPAKDSPGSVVVWGGEPPYSRPVSYSPEYGSSVKIKEWIEGLPRK